MFAIHLEADLAQTAGQDPTPIHRVILRIRRTGTLRWCSSSRSPTAAAGTGSSTGLVPFAGMMRIQPPGAGTTRIVPLEISRRMVDWTSGKWALAWRVSQLEPADSGIIASTLLSLKNKADMAEHPEEFDLVGLHVDEPPGPAGLLFILSSGDFRL
jgi:hypothetical protein